MIHYLYVGKFERYQNIMKLEKRQSDGAPRPVVLQPLDMAVARELLTEKGLLETMIPDEWNLAINAEEGFIVCDAYTKNHDVIDFIRNYARRTGSDIVLDGLLFISPNELTSEAVGRNGGLAKATEIGNMVG